MPGFVVVPGYTIIHMTVQLAEGVVVSRAHRALEESTSSCFMVGIRWSLSCSWRPDGWRESEPGPGWKAARASEEEEEGRGRCRGGTSCSPGMRNLDSD